MKYLIISLLVGVVLVAASGVVAQEAPEVGQDALIAGDVNVRNDTPSITFKSLFTLKMEQGRWLDVLEADSTVRILERKVVAGKYVWFRVSYDKEGKVQSGWVYSGKKGEAQQYVVPVENHSGMILDSSSRGFVATLLDLLSPSAAWAQDDRPVGNDAEASELSLYGVSVTALIILAIWAALSKFFCKLFKNQYFAFVCSMLVLVVLGILSPQFIQAVLENIPHLG